jgi:hypothetical protein
MKKKKKVQKYGPDKLTDDQHLYGLRKSIFRPFKDEREKGDRHWLIHQSFKKRLFYPIMKIMDIWLNKHMVKTIEDIPDQPYNVNFKILWKSFELGIEDWYNNFYRMRNKPKGDIINKKEMEENWKKKEELHWYRIPKFFMKLLLTIALEDTAYREQVNCLLFRIQGEMNKKWNPRKKHRFPMYTNRFDMEAAYFLEWLKLQGFRGQVLVNINNDDAKTAIKEANKDANGEKKTSVMELGKGFTGNTGTTASTSDRKDS